jgi:hypothetical protein
VVPVPPDTGTTPPPDPVALPTPTTVAPGQLTAPGLPVPTLTPTFSWSAVTGATGYVVAIRNTATGVIVYPSSTGVGPPIPATALTLPAGVLGAGTPYAWDVTAVNATSKSLASANRYFTTAPDTTTPPPLPIDTSHFAGPAELPRIYLNLPIVTPTRTVQVAAGANLQTALDAAQRGDELVLAAGATYTGNFTFNGCAAGWITLKSAATLPPRGTRARPSTSGSYAKVVTPNGLAALTIKGCRLRLEGVEVTVTATATDVYGIVYLERSASEIVLDHLWVHGLTNSVVVRCVSVHSLSTEITNSWLSDCHKKGQDSQAIWGAWGVGPYKIVNNHLEGAGENLMFGGADPTVAGLVPSDIEIRRNHFYTPLAWKGVWTKKNLFELKNAVRVLVEENVFDGSWIDGQDGWAMLLRSANQDGGCRWCRTTDVTFRRNYITHAAAGINFIGGVGGSPVDTTARRIFVSESVFDSIGAVAGYTGVQRGWQFVEGPADLTIERTVLTGSLNLLTYLDRNFPTQRLVFRDNVWKLAPINVDGVPQADQALAIGAPGYAWTGMQLIGAAATGWPPGTTWVASESAAPLAAQIRSIVRTATAGVVVPP